MPPGVAAVVFAVSLAATMGGSEILVRGLDGLGARFGLSEGILGLLTALGADAPEISSALAALHAGARDVGLGVVLGSNVFNLAALLGLGAVLAGRVRVHREGLLLDGGVGLLAAAAVALLLAGVVPPIPAVVILAILVAPYCAILAMRPERLVRLPLSQPLCRALSAAVSAVDREAAEDPRVAKAAGSWRAIALIAPALVIIVAGSAGMVSAALALAAAWGLPQTLVGAVALAGLTSLPNAYAAARLSLAGRGGAVVSETFNSNTINLLAGIALPALVLGAGRAVHAGLELGWLLGMTVIALSLLWLPGGLRRPGGITLVALYFAFVAVRVAAPGI